MCDLPLSTCLGVSSGSRLGDGVWTGRGVASESGIGLERSVSVSVGAADIWIDGVMGLLVSPSAGADVTDVVGWFPRDSETDPGPEKIDVSR